MERSDDMSAMLQDAGAGDLIGELDGLPPLPKGAKPAGKGGGSERVVDGEDDQDDHEDGSELMDELDLLGEGDGEGDGDEGEDDDGEPAGRGRAGERISQLARENRRLYTIVDRMLQGGFGDRQPSEERSTERKPTTPIFEFDPQGLKPPAGVDEADFREEIGATAPIVSAALNQFAQQILGPMAQQMAQLANVVGDMHLEKNLKGWNDPKIKPVRDAIFAKLTPQLQASLNNEAGAALLTLAAQGVVNTKDRRRQERDLDRRRGVIEAGGGTGEREAPNDNRRLRRLQQFTRTASDAQFLASVEKMEQAALRGSRR